MLAMQYSDLRLLAKNRNANNAQGLAQLEQFCEHVYAQGAQYGLIKEYGLNYIGIHDMS